jgi:hypothetical protein
VTPKRLDAVTTGGRNLFFDLANEQMGLIKLRGVGLIFRLTRIHAQLG